MTNEWTVALNRRLPIDLEASTGAGRATFDLTGLSGSTEITAGAGQVRVEFTAPRGTVKLLEFRGGVGKFEAVGLGNAGAEEIEVRGGVGKYLLDFSGFSWDVIWRLWPTVLIYLGLVRILRYVAV
ncbi:MAG: hypothetical protein ACREN5_02685 [Gemmatimonadales bacterium]